MASNLRRKFLEWVEGGPHLYVLTDPDVYGMTHHEIVDSVMTHGVRIVQIRDKKSTDFELYKEIMKSCEISRKYGGFLIVNDRVDMMLATGADGVHVGQHDLPVEVVRRLIGNRGIIGRSTHNEEEFVRAMKEDVDYIAVGPVYRSATKPEYGTAGIEFLAWACERKDRPICAIGGITVERVDEVVAAGADLIAVVRDLGEGGLEARLRGYREKLGSL